MDRDLQAILLADNPWLRGSVDLASWLQSHLPRVYIPREAVRDGARLWRAPGRAHLVVGPRQAGKSTAIWAFLAQRQEAALFIDCEQMPVKMWCRSAPLFLSSLAELTSQPVTLFFEEVQHLDNAGLFLKGLVDRQVDVPLLVTGSSSFALGARLRESLAGRATRTRLLPLSFAEVCADVPAQAPALVERQLVARFERHVRIGGYPEVWLAEEPEVLLTGLVEAIVMKDASDLFRISRPDAFRRLLRLAASQAGSLVNLSEWASVTGVSRDTVASYLEILESAHILARIRPFAGGRRSELTRSEKVFFIDPGIRNRILHDFRSLDERTDAGAAMESWVFSELWKASPAGSGVSFWRSTSKAEVDFVLDLPHTLIGIEVKAGRLGRRTIPRAARSFIEAYRPACFFMVNGDIRGSERLGATEVRWIAPWHLPQTIRTLITEGMTPPSVR